MMLELIRPVDRRRLYRLMPFVLLNALIQVVGIASIMPFLALVSNPDTIDTNTLLRWAYSAFGFTSQTSFLVFVGCSVLAVLVVSNGVAAWTQLSLLRFSWDMHHQVSVRMLREYLWKPYTFYLDHNTAAMAKNVLGDVRQAVAGYLVSGMTLTAHLMTSVLVFVLLVVVNPLLAVASLLLIGGSYLLIFRLVRQRVATAGRVRSSTNQERYKAANEALAGIKEIKVLGKEQPFLQRFKAPSWKFGRVMANKSVIAMLPRYVLETVAFGGMLLIVVVWLGQERDLANLLPTLGVFAFAAYRLLPALQSIFQGLTSMRFSASAVNALYMDAPTPKAGSARKHRTDLPPLTVRRRLELRNVVFAYDGAARPVFDGFDLVIEANTSVALVGPTGSGKTTAVDLLLGLLTPQEGSLCVDGEPVVGEAMAAWQRNVGYVPQVIFLADDTVAANIAFGIHPDDIDAAAVERAARQANIHDFVVRELPKGYATVVGERGVRLSGGQRQRLGIARALYHDPAVLILDEATSALDNVTEESVFGAVKEIGLSKTVVMIAHRISTVRDCDVIHVLDNGSVVAMGTFDELLAKSSAFRALARADASAASPVA